MNTVFNIHRFYRAWLALLDHCRTNHLIQVSPRQRGLMWDYGCLMYLAFITHNI